MDSQKFLILRLSAVGDVVRTLPAIRVLKECCPGSRVSWVVEEPSKALLESQPEIDEVILFPRRRWAQGLKSGKGVFGLVREARQFAAELRKRKFDVALDFHGIFKSGLISFFSGAPRRIGFDRKSSKEGNFLFSNVKVALPSERVNRFERNLCLLKGLGIEGERARRLMAEAFGKGLRIDPEDQEKVETFLCHQTRATGGPVIAVHPGASSKWLNKRWMPERYAQLADRLSRELRATVLFTWGPGEQAWVESIRKGMTEPSILGPKTESLTELAALFGKCDLYVGGDTGPMYTASSVGTPVVVIYGPTDPVLYEPLGPHQKVLKDVGCNPCRKRSCREFSCLKAVTVEDVFEAARKMLETAKR
jgi:lipopolysaccharide heptosyltransferase I